MSHARTPDLTRDFVGKDSAKIVEDAQQHLFDPADCRIIEIVESVKRQMMVLLDPTQGPFSDADLAARAAREAETRAIFDPVVMRSPLCTVIHTFFPHIPHLTFQPSLDHVRALVG